MKPSSSSPIPAEPGGVHDASARYWAVVPAGGAGLRVGADLPKQYLPLGGRCVLEHALAPLLAARWIEGVVVVLPPGDQRFAKLACAADPRVRVASGGAVRAESVLAGLRVVRQSSAAASSVFVLVHDAARPGLRMQDLEALREAASDGDGGLLALPLADTLKRAEGDRVAATVDRRTLWQAQTPQLFRLDRLLAALEQALADGLEVTDEARAMEAAGHRPRLVPGHAANLKVTTPEDLPVAEFWLRRTRGAA